METLLFFIGVIGNIISVFMFASPIKTFWRIVKNQSTEDFEPTPYVVTLLGSSLWVYYGLTKPHGLLVATVNSVGILLETIYVSLFLLFSSSSSIRMKTAVLVIGLDIGFFGLVVLATQIWMDGSLRLSIIGIICAFLNILMYGSPLAIMKTVINTRSVEYMPFFLSFFLFLNGGVWALYAILDHDIFLGIPNGIGFILGTFQLILYMIYMNPRVSKHMKADQEKSQQHQSLIEPIESIDQHDEEQG